MSHGEGQEPRSPLLDWIDLERNRAGTEGVVRERSAWLATHLVEGRPPGNSFRAHCLKERLLETH